MHCQLLITLNDIEPAIWRRVVVPGDFTLLDLHRVIQIAMGWQDYHLHDFTIRGKRYAVPSDEDFDEPENEETTMLRDVVKRRMKFIYQYDFGDGWDHLIAVEKIDEDATADEPVCIGGSRACPPEDSGGPWGYQEKLEALAKPHARRTAHLREWMGAFDPERFDIESVNRGLTAFASRRRRARNSASRVRRNRPHNA